MDTASLDTFLTVAEQSSFTKAASDLNLAQPTVTARIKKLERDLACDLFNRRGALIRLTTAGQRFRRYAHKIVKLSRMAEETVLEAGSAPGDALTVAADSGLTTYRLVPIVEYLYRRYPDLALEIRPLEASPWTRLGDSDVDCAFFIDVCASSPRADSTLLCPEPLVVVADRDGPLAQEPVTTPQLAKQPLLCAHRGSGYQRMFERTLGAAGDTGVRALSFGSVDAVKRALTAGLGVSLLPRLSVAAELAEGRLTEVPWTAPFQVFTQVAWHREIRNDPRFSVLLDAAARATAEQVADAGTRPARRSTS
ncbi:LysR family transcriptional regulator [Amycolatopsis balhimycina DSM 5908]|uniref:LysR family transcriptional regulator n=1 Tax=Amycolatopsis balhimycina DSM 5908 TaxID=1081091 RepID=A0A428WWH1_AMYBA|nr:LysR family transcriptional regulator [Amycolatopsis balhimycina]RSM47357.1 LysR family transcriptional regulator [Amycolatopsis balhimycina DSM 5908]